MPHALLFLMSILTGMRNIIFALMFAVMLSAQLNAAEMEQAFLNPVAAFAPAILEMLQTTEKASVETTLRGFIARCDTFPGFRDFDSPSSSGIYLNVAIKDGFEETLDRTTQKADYIERVIQLPSGDWRDPCLVIAIRYGEAAPKGVMEKIEKCFSGIKEAKRANNAAPANPRVLSFGGDNAPLRLRGEIRESGTSL